MTSLGSGEWQRISKYSKALESLLIARDNDEKHLRRGSAATWCSPPVPRAGDKGIDNINVEHYLTRIHLFCPELLNALFEAKFLLIELSTSFFQQMIDIVIGFVGAFLVDNPGVELIYHTLLLDVPRRCARRVEDGLLFVPIFIVVAEAVTEQVQEVQQVPA